MNVAQSADSSCRDVAAHSPLHPKAAAASASVAAKEASSSCAPKVFDMGAVPVVKVSGPLLRSCSKAVSTIVGDPDMVWFVSPGEIAPTRACAVLFRELMPFCQWTTRRYSCMTIPRL